MLNCIDVWISHVSEVLSWYTTKDTEALNIQNVLNFILTPKAGCDVSGEVLAY